MVGLMPWWGWLLISVLGLVSMLGVVLAGGVIYTLSHMFDNWLCASSA
jgi:hypothetical protein